MGTVILGLLLAAAVARAEEVQVRIVATDGAIHQGDLVHLEISAELDHVAWKTGELPLLEVDAGQLTGPAQAAGPGRWTAAWQVPADVPVGRELSVRVELAEQAASTLLPVQALPRSALRLPPRVDGHAGQPEPLELRVSGEDLPPPEALEIVLGAGSLHELRATEGGLSVQIQVPEDPLPRIVPVGLRDRRRPHAPTAWTHLRLAGRPRVPIETDPGAQVSLEVGGRVYGPVTAGADGVATVSVEVQPGETTARVTARDALGNEQKSTIALGGRAEPTLVIDRGAALVPGQALPHLYVAAFREDGRPWGGAAPVCRSGLAGTLTLVAMEEGRWRATLPAGADQLFELKVECVLADQARALVTVPVDAQVPAQVRLRVWPTEVDADLPVAQVQAWLEGATGERLAASGLTLTADHGQLSLEPGGPAMVVASYQGEAAVELGGDEIRARWSPPPGEGGVYELALGVASVDPAGRLAVQVLARDHRGRPLAQVPVQLQAGPAQATGLTGADGRSLLSLDTADPLGPWLLAARSADVAHQHLVFLAEVGPQGLPEADLTGRVFLPVRSGEVRRIFMEAEPDALMAGGAESARIRVQLQDQAGRSVTDAALRIEASEGKVGRVRQVEDGSFEAEYRPPPRMAYGEVQLEVRGQGDWSARTSVQVTPRRIRTAIGLNGGWLYTANTINSPWVSADLDLRLPGRKLPVLARLSVGGYAAREAVTDPTTQDAIDLDLSVLPIGLGLLGRQERGRLALSAGAGFVLAPYRLVATYGGTVGARGLGLAPPGGEIHGSAGWRLGNNELQLGASYLLLSLPASDVGWQGPIGGLKGTLGWRLLY